MMIILNALNRTLTILIALAYQYSQFFNTTTEQYYHYHYQQLLLHYFPAYFS